MRFRVGVLDAMLMVVAIVWATTASAFAACAPARGDDFVNHRLAYWQKQPTGSLVGGVYSEMNLYDPYVNPDRYAPGCGPGPLDCEDSSLAWIGLTSNSLIAQDGWKKWYDGTYLFFTEYQDLAGGYHQNIYGIESVGSIDSFHVLFGSNPGACGQQACWTFMKNYVTIDIEPAAWQPYAALVGSETHTFASQLAGGSTVNQFFKNTQLYTNTYGWDYFSNTAYGILSQCVSVQTTGATACGQANHANSFNWTPPGYSTPQYGTNSVYDPSSFYTADIQCTT